MEIVVNKIVAADELEAALAIRRRVFSVEQGIPEKLDQDGFDERAVHVIARAGDLFVATGRLLPEVDGTGHLARIAVLPGYRDRGLGKRIVLELERQARQLPLRRVELDAHEFLQSFYENLGYRLMPNHLRVAGYRLIKMEKEITREISSLI